MQLERVASTRLNRGKPFRIRLARLTLSVVVVGYFVFSVFPVIWVALLSVKTRQDAVAFPPPLLFSPTLANYQEVVGTFEYRGGSAANFARGSDFASFLKNSLIVVGTATIVSMVLGTLAAYALARIPAKKWIKENILFTVLSFRFLPEMAIIVPLFVIFARLQLTNTYIGLIWIYQLIGIPLVVLIMVATFSDLPVELEDAARVDGAGYRQVFFRVMLPLVKPALASSLVLAFIFGWNSFIFALVLGGPDTMPVTAIALNYLSSQETALGQMAAATVLGAAPSLILAITIQRFLVTGLTLGAVRG